MNFHISLNQTISNDSFRCLLALNIFFLFFLCLNPRKLTFLSLAMNLKRVWLKITYVKAIQRIYIKLIQEPNSFVWQTIEISQLICIKFIPKAIWVQWTPCFCVLSCEIDSSNQNIRQSSIIFQLQKDFKAN